MTVAHRLNLSRSRLLIIAAAGYGKSVLLEAQRPKDGVTLTAAELRGSGVPDGPSWVGVDDFDDLVPDDQARVLGLLSATTGVDLAIASRAPVTPELRRRLPGQVYERGPADLALGGYAIAVVLCDEYAVTDPEAAVRVRDLTAGWPALVHFAGDLLARDPQVDLSLALVAPGAAAATWLETVVIDPLPAPVRHVLGTVVRLGPVTQRLGATVARASGLDPGEFAKSVDALRQMGLLVPRRRAGGADELVVVPAVATVLVRQQLARELDRSVLLAAARAYEAEGAWLAAAQARALDGDETAVSRLVMVHGEEMLRRGDALGVVALLETHASGECSPIVQRTLGEALRMSGDASGARRAFEPLVQRAEREGWDATLATRVAAVHYLSGEFAKALHVLDLVGEEPAPATDGELIEWLACRVHVLSMLGRTGQARSVAARALEGAERSGAAWGLCLAHLAAARTCTGVSKEAHLETALLAAARAGDAVTAARVLASQTHLLLTCARYAEACVVAREAVRMAELSSPPGLLAVALHNLGEALSRVGEFAESRWQLQRSVAVCRRLGPGRSAMGLVGIAEIHRQLGHQEQARSAYREAIGLARDPNDLQVLVPALAGLARLMAGPSVDPSDGTAPCLAAEAEQIATPALLPVAQVARGWVALARGDRVEAAAHAACAVASARLEQGVDVLAEGLELAAESTDNPAASRLALTEALSIWREGGAVPAVARVEVLLGRLPGADATDRSRGREAGRYLQRLGVLRVHGHHATEDRGTAAVDIQVLGPFRVSVEGSEVALPAWRSRQARTLVKILAARRGRVVTRAHLCELIWPDDDPARTGHRLSVLLATVRGVLDPPRAWPPDRYVLADQTGIRLDLTHVAIDADALIRDAAFAAELTEAGDGERAREILTSIETRYHGDAFEDEPAGEWADGLREEVRSAWVRSVRRLASLHGRAGRGGESLGLLLRLLLIDPYDEQVHRKLVTSLTRAGRHGEARRAFARWVQAMRAIDAPLPDPALLRPAGPAPRTTPNGQARTSVVTPR